MTTDHAKSAAEPVALYATMKALPGKEKELLALLAGLSVEVRREAGNERFVVYTLANDPLSVHVEETYRDKAAFEAHMNTAHGKAFNQAIVPLVQGGKSEVVFLHPL